ncbi:MAG: SpoIIE family protein phosphatase [Phycisphaerae bacterium]|nr:SpoIIE family protein phosphatase [Phycisphaerae bacterium]
MAKMVSIRWHLLSNLVLIILLLSGAIMGTMVYGTRGAVLLMSRLVISQTINQAEGQLARFFEPVVDELELIRSWGESGVFQTEDSQKLQRMLVPVMAHHKPIAMVGVSDGQGNKIMVTQNGQAHTIKDSPPPGDAAALKQKNDIVHWVQNERVPIIEIPGLTLSTEYISPAGQEHRVEFCIPLINLQDFVQNIRIHDQGNIFVLTDAAPPQVIGYSNKGQLGRGLAGKDIFLKSPRDLNLPFFQDADRAFRGSASHGQVISDPVRFSSENQVWWGAGRYCQLSPNHELMIFFMVPESDLLGRLQQRRQWVAMIALVVLLGGIIRAFMLANRLSKPLELLAHQSERISKGRLEPGEPVVSAITEVGRLTRAHEKMRLGLKTLFKLETDLRLARQIQQNTIPASLPHIEGFDIKAWNEPADETGGDTFDVVGIKSVQNDGVVELTTGNADRALILLADATGHGIGPALSVTQLRAMLRMAARIKPDVSTIATQINEQLNADLPEGRFITAWLCDINSSNGILKWFSAGQGPLLYYRAQTDSVEQFKPDSLPLGIVCAMDASKLSSVEMARGDIFAVISDGIFEARNPQRQQFGMPRVTTLLQQCHQRSAAAILERLREAVNDFSDNASPQDDQTVIIIKRL